MTLTPCLDHVEDLSAYLDGELAPEESQRLKDHLAGCPGCRAAQQAMEGLGSTLGAAPLSVDKLFAPRTAHYVRSQLRPPMWTRLSRWWSHPVHDLVGSARRRKLRFGPRDFFKVTALFGLPALLMSLLSDSAPLITFLSVTAVALLVGIPARHLTVEVSLLSSLRRGRCLEEILSTGLSPAGLVDALARQGLWDALRACLAVLPALVIGAQALPANLRPLGLEIDCLWLPLTAALFLSGSYVCQLLLACAGSTPALVVAGTLTFGPPLASLAGMGPDHLLPWTLAIVWLALVGRKLAVWALSHPERIQASRRLRRDHQRNRYFALGSDNPITRRELSRVSGSLPQGLKGLIVYRLSTIGLPLLWAWWACGQGDHWSRAFWFGVAFFSLGLGLLAANRTLGAVVKEREQGTWETLLNTSMGLTTFLRGWLEVALYTVFADGAFGIFSLGLFGVLAPRWLVASGSVWDGLRVTGLAGVTLVWSVLVGAIVGLAVSASSNDSREAASRLGSLLFKGLAAWLLSWGAWVCALMPWMSDVTGDNCLDLIQHDCLLAATMTVGLGLGLWSSATLRSQLALAQVAPAQPRSARYPVTLYPLELAALGFLAYFGLVLVLSQEGADSVNFQPFQVSLGLVGLVAAWVGLVRLPLATLAELSLGSLVSPLVGVLLGLLAAVSLPMLLIALQAMARTRMMSMQNLDLLPQISEPVIWACLLACPLIGLVLGSAGARWPRPDADRSRALGLRLAASAGLSLASLALVLSQGYRLFSVEVSNPQEFQRIISQAQARELHQSRVLESRNGFAPLRYLLYGGSDKKHSGGSSWQVLGDGPEYSTRGFAEYLTQAKIVRARAHFLHFLPQLQEALGRPEFAIPYRLDPTARVPNFIRTRSIGRCLEALGWGYQLQGQLDKALDTYCLGLTWGDRFSGQGSLIHQMIAVSLEGLPLVRLLSLESSRALEPAQYRRIIAQVETSRFQPQDLGQCMENEFASLWLFLDQPAERRGEVRISALCGLPLPSFYMRYEQTALTNVYLQWLPQLNKLKRVPAPEEMLQPYPLATMTRAVLPNPSRAVMQYASMLTRLEAVRTVAALQLYRHDHGDWPANLDQLVGPYLKTAPQCYSCADRKFSYRPGHLSAPGLMRDRNRAGQEVELYPYPEDP